MILRRVSHRRLDLRFLQRVSIACYAERCISYSKSVRPSVRPSVRHTLALCQNDSSYDHGVFTEDSPMTLVSSTLNFTAKFQREHGERGRRMREG